MLILKNRIDLLGMKEAARVASKSLRLAKKNLRDGISASYIDDMIREFILSQGARPSFLGYFVEGRVYQYSTCISVNDEVVHGLPSRDKILKSPMLVKIDVGVERNGYHADTAWTFALGEVSQEALDLMKATKEALYEAINVCIKGNRVSQITNTIYRVAKRYGFNPAKGVTGHGIGFELHEDPIVFNHPYDIDRDWIIKVGMGLAIEPMINSGKAEVITERDGWTIKTKDRRWSAHYEHTIYVGEDGPNILTEDIDG